MVRLLRIFGRACLGAIFVSSGVDLFNDPAGRAKRAAEAIPVVPETPLLGRIHGAVMLGAGSALSVGVLPALSAGVLAGTLVPNTYVGHAFWKVPDAAQRKPQLIHFLKNLAIAGGLLTVIADERGRKQG